METISSISGPVHEVQMTPEQLQELQDFRKLLNEEQQAYFDLIIEKRGEAAVYASLGWLRSQLEYANHL